MNWPAGAILGLVALIGITVITGSMLIYGLIKGTVYSHRVGYSRRDDPSSFWFYTIAYAAVFLSSGGFLAYVGLGILIYG